jgi:hypothetical protein
MQSSAFGKLRVGAASTFGSIDTDWKRTFARDARKDNGFC